MFLIQYRKGDFINAEEISILNAINESGFVFFKIKANPYNFRVSKDYEDSFLNDLKTLDANNYGNKLTQHKYK
tara:strand:+ start:514 stop:732 length:219 start_codon:yes stop_codon:yes gene_type:complete